MLGISAKCYHPGMVDSAAVSHSEPVVPATTVSSRHSGVVRVTHWITTLCLVALFVTGMEIVISHPRFYWGESGNIWTKPLFRIPIPSSRESIPNGFSYQWPDQNGWSRYLHFQAAWVLVLVGLLYIVNGLVTRHFRKDLVPAEGNASWRALPKAIAEHLRFKRPTEAETGSYNVLQRLTYLAVIFVLFPAEIWTGLAMSPAFVSAFPFVVDVLGGQQSARTLHFFIAWSLMLFVVVHVVMVCRTGFKRNMRGMISGVERP